MLYGNRMNAPRRIATPAATLAATLAAGVSHVVIARPTISHPDPVQAARLTTQEVAAES